MPVPMEKIALIPAYQPTSALCQTLQSLTNTGFTCIVVDDGSQADYDYVFIQAASYAQVLQHTENKGKGAALKTGIKYISEHFEEPYAIVCVDADGQHAAKDASRVLEEAIRHPSALVLGCRHFTGKVPFRSRFGNDVTKFFFRLSTGRKIKDTQTGLRAFTNASVKYMLEISGERYEYEMNTLLDFVSKNREIRQIPIQTIYEEHNPTSHFHVFKDSVLIYKQLLKFAASSFVSFLLDYGLFCLFFWLSGHLAVSNILARVFSGVFNYLANRNFVFQAGKNISLWKSAFEYFLLAAGLIIASTILVEMFVSISILPWIAKILSECLLFLVSYSIQHSVIFKKEVPGV